MLGSEQAKSHPALIDAPTGLANGLHFELVYTYMFDAGNRGLPFTVMLISVGFGDEGKMDQISSIGQTIKGATRSSDLVAHVGVGRYAVLLLGTNQQGARIAADRIEIALGDAVPGTLSFGLAPYRDGYENAQLLLREADTALLAAEASGGGIQFT
jgi:GGDEF domain-containing protein